MSKQVFDDNLNVLGLPDKAALNAMIDMTPDTIPYKDEIFEVMESISAVDLANFLEVVPPTDLAIAFQNLRTD